MYGAALFTWQERVEWENHSANTDQSMYSMAFVNNELVLLFRQRNLASTAFETVPQPLDMRVAT